jgi:hypothetical protein
MLSHLDWRMKLKVVAAVLITVSMTIGFSYLFILSGGVV